jgi:hypothetical protein
MWPATMISAALIANKMNTLFLIIYKNIALVNLLRVSYGPQVHFFQNVTIEV